MNGKLADVIAELAIAFSMKGKGFIPDPIFAKLFDLELAGEEVQPLIQNLSGGEALLEYQKFIANKNEAQAVSTMLLAHQRFLLERSPESLTALQATETQPFAKERLLEDPLYLKRAKKTFLLVHRERNFGPSWRDPKSLTGYMVMMMNLQITRDLVCRVKPPFLSLT